MPKTIQKRLLEYAYNKHKKENLPKFRLEDVFKDFEETQRENIITGLNKLVEYGLIYQYGELAETRVFEMYEYECAIEFQISKRGHDVFKNQDQPLIEKIIENFKDKVHF